MLEFKDVRELIVTVMALEALLHWFPWRMVPMFRGKELPRLASYTLGLLGIMVPLSVWLMDRGLHDVMEVLWLAVCSAGASVFICYGVDHYLDLNMKSVESDEREQHGKK